MLKTPTWSMIRSSATRFWKTGTRLIILQLASEKIKWAPWMFRYNLLMGSYKVRQKVAAETGSS